MDTPERSKIGGTPLSKFEDSPIFNFINNLSPIQPVKSAHGTQVFHSLSYASISSVFSSPHINLQKESRFLIRHSDSSKLEISSDNLDESNLCPGIPDADNPAAARENCNIICLLNKASVDPPEECSTQPSNLPQPIQYDCGSPNHNTKPCYGIKAELKLGSQNPDKVTQLVHDGVEKRKILFATEFEFQEEHQRTQNSEKVSACVWENLISEDADDLLIFNSPANAEDCKGQDEKFKDNDASFLMCPSPKPQDITDILQTTQSDVPFGPCLQNATQFPPPGNNEEVAKHQGTDHTPQILSGTCQNQVASNDQNKKTGNGPGGCISVDCKIESHHQRGMRRRCLTFELANSSTKNSNPYSSNSLPVGEKLTSNDKKSLSLKPGTSSSSCILPSIGLHLNTLATTPKDRMVTKETFAFGKRLISTPCTISPFPPISASQRLLNKSMDVEKDQCPIGSEAPNLEVTRDDSEAPEFGGSENLSQSPKKKKRKSENGGESEACKRCNCKKSKCLKLYCECFAAGIYCVEPCSCQECFNKPIHEETVLATRKQIESRNPLAFAPKVIRASEPVQEVGEEANKTPASARHKRGCNCKKSSCLKKYCECYQGGVGCSPSCRCEGCKNAFGRKNAEEVELVEEGMDGCEKQQDSPQEDEQNDIAQKSEHHSSENIVPLTPFEICRPSVKLPFHSSGKPPRSSSRSIGFPTGPTPQTLRRCEFPFLQSKLTDRFKNGPEDDTPEILKGDTSSNNGVKTVSPNGKRVSPPHNALGISPNRKGGRKLILKSIPSFPSLNSDVSRENPMEYSSGPFNSPALN